MVYSHCMRECGGSERKEVTSPQQIRRHTNLGADSKEDAAPWRLKAADDSNKESLRIS